MNIRLKELENKWQKLRKEEGFRRAPVPPSFAWFSGQRMAQRDYGFVGSQ